MIGWRDDMSFDVIKVGTVADMVIAIEVLESAGRICTGAETYVERTWVEWDDEMYLVISEEYISEERATEIVQAHLACGERGWRS